MRRIFVAALVWTTWFNGAAETMTTTPRTATSNVDELRDRHPDHSGGEYDLGALHHHVGRAGARARRRRHRLHGQRQQLRQAGRGFDEWLADPNATVPRRRARSSASTSASRVAALIDTAGTWPALVGTRG